jgi:hypothetical protein
MAAPISILGDAHVPQIAAFTGRDAQRVRCTLPPICEGDGRGVGQANDVAPAKPLTRARPVPVAKATVSQEGDPSRAFEEHGDVVKHCITGVERDSALAGHDFPRQRQGTVAVRE